jgi:valyl-tRNA synthetase
MSKEPLPKTYDFRSTESRIYELWEKGGYFKPWNDPNRPGFDPSVKPFVISIPPPNVTGELHLGHAARVATEDLMIRYHRMKGIPTLWVPGTDHAGIATQLQVERHLLKTEEVTREELGREEFVKRTWAWKEKYGGIITGQIRRLGASCDWDRERFTLDAGLSRAVREAFVTLYDKGLIYRGPRMINWSPGLKTAVSDLEVEYSEEDATLYYFKYMLKPASGGPPDPEKGEHIPVATVRPETILGDTAVAVHPDDERYKRFVGRMAIVPILGREIPVIADDYVSREFGTGALKITPGHDPNDYEIGRRHGLPLISVLDREAKVNENGGQYQGLDRFAARERMWADMKAAGLTLRTEAYRTTLPRSQRGGEIVEPMISTQWFVKIQPLADQAVAAVRDGQIRIVPEHFEKVYFNWLENIKDWCISRQLWWGHRIPVWYCPDGHMTVEREDPARCSQCGSTELQQDPDVLDTWFSSGLWPFSTLGWPEETLDYKYFYPTSYMETAYDILFFWVARMIMDGLEFTGQVPFHTVYLSGLIRDERGVKMSKTHGNVIDPLPVMDELGTDALRFSLLVGSTPGKDINVSIKKVEANRNFANKLWNAGRFVISAIASLTLGPLSSPEGTSAVSGETGVRADDWSLADSWVWARLEQLIRDVDRLSETFQYGQAGQLIYDFFWGDFADWYVEIAKQQLADDAARERTALTLTRVLDASLRLLHPFTPYVTEELWGHLKMALLQSPLADLAKDWPQMLITASWPEARRPEGWEAQKLADFTLMQEIVRAIRNLRAEKNVKPGRRIAASISGGYKTPVLKEQSSTLIALSGLDAGAVEISEEVEKPADSLTLVIGPVEIHLPLTGLVDPDAERDRLGRELAQAQAQVTRLEKLLASDFAVKAPPALVQKEREKLAAYRETADKIGAQLR